MTTGIAAGAQADRNTAARRESPPSFRSVAWVAWRQQRTALAVLGLLAAAISAWLVLTGLRVRSAAQTIERTHCALSSPACLSLYERLGSYKNISGPAFAVPVVAALFIAAPLFARGYETGSLRFALTQGVSRARWALPQLLVPAVASVVICMVPAIVGAWWLSEVRAPEIGTWRWDRLLFNMTPLMLACWLLLGLSIGILASAVTRRTVPAMTATFVALVAMAIAAYSLLPRVLLPVGARAIRQSQPILTTCSSGGCLFPDPSGQQYYTGIIASGWFTHAGHRLTAGQAADLIRVPLKIANATNPRTLPHWLAARHYTYWISYQPGSRYWLFQGALAVILITLAAGLAALAIWILRRRSA